MSNKATPPRNHLLLGWDKSEKCSTAGSSALWAPDEGHLITVAPTGAGKGVSCIVPALLTWPGPAIVIDPKAENYAVTARRRRELGQEVVLFDPFDVAGTGNTARLNPFDLFDPADPAVDDAKVIANLCTHERSVLDPFWDERAVTLITGLIVYVMRESPPLLRNLAEVRYLIESRDRDQQLAAADMRRVGRTDLMPAANILALGSDRTRAAIITTASSHMSFLTSGPVERVLSSSTFNLADVENGTPLTIYLVLPPDKLATHAKLLRLWLGVFMASLARRRRIPEYPTLVLVDEAAQLGNLPELKSAITLMRGYGVRVWTFWQDLSQIAAIYPRDWHTIVNNCALQLFFRPATPFTAELIEGYLAGTSPVPLSKLSSEEAILIRDGRPKRIVRADYRADKLFAGLYEANPFYGDTLPRQSGPASGEHAADNVVPFPGSIDR